MVLFDGAPLSLVSDALTIGGRVDGVLAVVRAGEVSRGMVGRVRDQLRGVRANLLGIVLNAAQTHGAGYFKQNYRTFYKYAGQGNRAGASA
jgi:Mrp family chromosome partitioning ATPase